jgi:hypothetical protein
MQLDIDLAPLFRSIRVMQHEPDYDVMSDGILRTGSVIQFAWIRAVSAQNCLA